MFRTIRALTVVVVIASLAVFLIWPRAGWVAGLFAGMMLAFDLSTRLNPPGWIEQWQAGAFGEQRTARELLPLQSSGWTLLHDVPLPSGANIDHVLVGPPGVFVLDSKSTDGSIRRDGADLIVSRPGAIRLGYTLSTSKQVLGNAAHISKVIRETTGKRIWVKAVVVLWGTFDEQRATHGDVQFVHGSAALGWLSEQPEQLSAGVVLDIANSLRSPPAEPTVTH